MKAKLIYRLVTRSILGPIVYEKIQFRRHTGYWCDLKSPKTFNEKICCRKVSRDMKDAVMLQDKVAVREYVKKTVGDEYLSKCFQVLEEPEDLDYNALPDSFVVKGNDGCGPESLLIVNDKKKFTEKEIRENISRILRRHDNPLKRFYLYSNEWWYGMIKPKVIIEEHLLPGTGNVPLDYKFFVFHGKVQYIQVDFGRFVNHTRSLYDTEWRRQDFKLGYPVGPDAARPTRLEEMIRIAEKLGSNYDFVRVDLYQVDDERIVFGEITIAPSLGHARFEPVSWDRVFGDLW
ncbi:hypothetical protein FHR95_003263 [Halomonas fontilapidosi]|uniref:Uncharacterized protein n=1 Tax=Halomonas fontilapidosi TaxID=616675 RepID=A0A7W5H0U0_9GAMM|nr:ATP-grasp fold amidoligase family protein [Halomonas fontilapidosi]MBB3185672.1 hypothetical protein [Halomonas fontilapidosi]